MEIIQTGSIFPTASPSSSQSGRQLSKTYPKGRSRVEILPNDDERVVRAGTWCELFLFWRLTMFWKLKIQPTLISRGYQSIVAERNTRQVRFCADSDRETGRQYKRQDQSAVHWRRVRDHIWFLYYFSSHRRFVWVCVFWCCLRVVDVIDSGWHFWNISGEIRTYILVEREGQR